MEPTLTLALILVATSVLSVLAALMLAAALGPRRGTGSLPDISKDAVFLIAEGLVVDANDPGTCLLATLRDQQPASVEPGLTQGGPAASLHRLLKHLGPAFPDLGARIAEGARLDPWTLSASDGSDLKVSGTAVDGALRLKIYCDRTTGVAPTAEDTVLLDRFSWQALNDELRLLRRTNDVAPTPAWRERADGQVVWANGAYLRLLAETGSDGASSWPLPNLFAGRNGQSGRHSVVVGLGGRRRWFDLNTIPEGTDTLVFALAADDAQQAERARREFVQTLTKTFASLPVGLAVFDRTRRLQLFNPALTDLTRLEPEFLASRPGMEGFLNRMRDKRILPEPRDYRAWSRRLLEVESVAAGTAFEETWALPDGRSFRVSAAPHPDGALAFLIEDVTSDAHLRRSFRAELDIGRAALDMVETAVSVFSASGDLVMTNAAFDRLWTFEGSDTLSGVQFGDAVANWRDVAAESGGDTELWDRIAMMARPGSGTMRTAGVMVLPDGETLQIEAKVAPGGGVLLGFCPVASLPPLTTVQNPVIPTLRRA